MTSQYIMYVWSYENLVETRTKPYNTGHLFAIVSTLWFLFALFPLSALVLLLLILFFLTYRYTYRPGVLKYNMIQYCSLARYLLIIIHLISLYYIKILIMDRTHQITGSDARLAAHAAPLLTPQNYTYPRPNPTPQRAQQLKLINNY